jgi:hypothetical protein
VGGWVGGGGWGEGTCGQVGRGGRWVVHAGGGVEPGGWLLLYHGFMAGTGAKGCSEEYTSRCATHDCWRRSSTATYRWVGQAERAERVATVAARVGWVVGRSQSSLQGFHKCSRTLCCRGRQSSRTSAALQRSDMRPCGPAGSHQHLPGTGRRPGRTRPGCSCNLMTGCSSAGARTSGRRGCWRPPGLQRRR